MNENELSKIVLDLCIKIHKQLGPGLYENVYKEILIYELRKAGLNVQPEKAIPVIWEDVKMNVGYRADLLIENKLVIEMKSTDSILPAHKKQLLTYIVLLEVKLGMVINFGAALMKDGVSRVVNNL